MGWSSVRGLVLAIVMCVSIAGAGNMALAATPLPDSRVFQVDGQTPGLPAPSQPAGGGIPGAGAAPAQDQDGMLPPVLDPDDDDDGVQDADDSHPNDPTRGEKPPAGPTDPIADDDSDGLPNVMDPDDNSNGIPDAEDGVGTKDPVLPAVPETPGTGNPQAPGPGPAAQPGRGGGDTPLVRSLPSTGTGSAKTSPTVPIFLIGSILLLATSHWSRRRSRP